MFSGLSQIGACQSASDSTQKDVPSPTPVKFPRCTPRAGKLSSRRDIPLVALLQAIHRPSDLRLAHFEALGLYIESEASPQDLLPDQNFLPPTIEWNAVPREKLLDLNESTRKRLNNGNLSPGVHIYRERQKELLTDNTSAFRTIRRIPPPTGEAAARLGNAYEFFKNLEYFSSFWQDTSLSVGTTTPDTPDTLASSTESDETPFHLRTHVRSGTGSQLPPEYRQKLLSAFVKLVAYDFNCNVANPRVEPRLHLTPSSSSPLSYFNSSATFIYRTPTDRSAARAGIVEGPVATLSARNSTGFATDAEERLDLAREVIAVLLTAQQRAREHKREIRFGEDKWWTSKPRWGGGPGGPIGRECERQEIADDIASLQSKASANLNVGTQQKTGGVNSGVANSPSPSKRARTLKDGNMAMYQPYRKLAPPSPIWDRKTCYCAIGKVESSGYDDVFLVSALNHHISILRARVPEALLRVLDGGDEEWGRMSMWRSPWFDMFLKDDRVAAMNVIWGMMAWLMREARSRSRNDGFTGHNHDKEIKPS